MLRVLALFYARLTAFTFFCRNHDTVLLFHDFYGPLIWKLVFGGFPLATRAASSDIAVHAPADLRAPPELQRVPAIH